MKKLIQKLNFNKREVLLGTLLLFPIYIVVMVFIIETLKFLNTSINSDPLVVLATLMYLPIVIGLILSCIFYKGKSNYVFSFVIAFFICVAIYFFHDTYYVDHEGWDGLGPFFLWICSTGIIEIASFIYYGKLVGWKKSICFFLIDITIIGLSLVLGFWA